MNTSNEQQLLDELAKTDGKEEQQPQSQDLRQPQQRPTHGLDNFSGVWEQQRQPVHNEDVRKGKWKRQVGAAKILWGRLTDDELLKAEGHVEKLVGLVQERYGITRDEANKQVENFFDYIKS